MTCGCGKGHDSWVWQGAWQVGGTMSCVGYCQVYLLYRTISGFQMRWLGILRVFNPLKSSGSHVNFSSTHSWNSKSYPNHVTGTIFTLISAHVLIRAHPSFKEVIGLFGGFPTVVSVLRGLMWTIVHMCMCTSGRPAFSLTQVKCTGRWGFFHSHFNLIPVSWYLAKVTSYYTNIYKKKYL